MEAILLKHVLRRKKLAPDALGNTRPDPPDVPAFANASFARSAVFLNPMIVPVTQGRCRCGLWPSAGKPFACSSGGWDALRVDRTN